MNSSSARHFHEAVVAIPGVMKAGNGFHNVVRIHVADQVLERSEGETGLIGLARVFHYVVRMRAGQIVVAAPDAVSGDVYVVAPAARRVEIQRLRSLSHGAALSS